MRGLAYFGKGDFRSAIADLDRAIELDPRLAIAFQLRAACYADLGDTAKAEADAQEARRLDPSVAK